MLTRERHRDRLLELLRRHPVVAILGARQVGKTTLARRLAQDLDRPVHFFDLEDPEDLARLSEPKLALEALEGVVVLESEPGSAAWNAGLREGDVIVSANRQRVRTVDELRQAIRGSDALLLNIRRGSGALFLLLR